MAEHSIEPGSRCYNVMLLHYIQTTNLEMCLQILHDMLRRGFDVETERMLLSVYELAAVQGHPRLALDLVRTYETQTSREIGMDLALRILDSSIDNRWVGDLFSLTVLN